MRTYARKGTAAQRTTADESDATGAHSRQTLGLSSILHLQRTVGNQVVQRLIEEDATLVKDVSHKGIEDEDEPMRAEKIGAARDMLVIQGSGVLAADMTRAGQERGGGLLHQAQRQPDAGVDAGPAAPNVPAPAGRATINYKPTLMDQAPTGWGVTTEDDVVIDISAYTSGTSWKCKITTADQQAHQGVRLLPGVVEVTAALVSGESDCGKLTTMSTSLNTVANQGANSGFYMISAVQAHENLHITQYRADLNPAYATFRTAVEGLSVPQAGNPDAASAKVAIKALPAYTTALATFHAADVAANNKTAAHTNAASFNAVEHGIVDPMIATIAARRTALTCPP